MWRNDTMKRKVLIPLGAVIAALAMILLLWARKNGTEGAYWRTPFLPREPSIL